MGGFLVDQLSWHWVFFVNVIPGLLAVALVGSAWRDVQRSREQTRPAIDFAGVGLLSLGVVSFLLALLQFGRSLSWVLILVAVACFSALYFVERRAVDPILPLRLFRDRLFTVAVVQGLLAGWAMFGSANYVPLFGQAVMGLTATGAGSMLTPQMLSWVAASIIGSRLLLRIGYRTVAVTGMILLVAGTFLMTRIASHPSTPLVVVSLGLMGSGMGLAMPAFLIAVQNEVRRDMLGAATATLTFSRNIGGTLGVAIMGAILTAGVTSGLLAAGIAPGSVPLSSVLGGGEVAALGAEGPAVVGAIGGAIANVFVAAFVAAILALLVTLLAPGHVIGERGSMGAAAERPVTEPEPLEG